MADTVDTSTDGLDDFVTAYNDFVAEFNALGITGQWVAGASYNSATDPGFTFSGDTNTGFYSDEADHIKATIGGSQVLDWDAAAFTVTGDLLAAANAGSERRIGVANSTNTDVVLSAGAASGQGGNIILAADGANVYEGASSHTFEIGGSTVGEFDSLGFTVTGELDFDTLATINKSQVTNMLSRVRSFYMASL